MSYVRFRNTLKDLKDCVENIEETLEEEESIARAELIRVCQDVARDFPNDDSIDELSSVCPECEGLEVVLTGAHDDEQEVPCPVCHPKKVYDEPER